MKNSFSNLIENIRKSVEETCGYVPKVIHNFNDLSISISVKTGRNISPTTLRRIWGYQESDKHIQPSLYTLDTLSCYAGYKTWDEFCKCTTAPSTNSSRFINNDSLYTSEIPVDSIIRLTWNPNRQVFAQYLGSNTFKIIESINSKLQAGWMFKCSVFIKNMSLCISILQEDDSEPQMYCCGIKGGIDYLLQS